MPRKPNYKFERLERQRAKAEKKAARLKEKAGEPENAVVENDTDSDEAAPDPAWHIFDK